MQTEAQYKAVIDTIADGVLMIDQNGIIEIFNRAAEKIFGYVQADVIGKDVSLLMRDEDAIKYKKALVRYLETNRPKLTDKTIGLVAKRADNSIFPIELSLSKLEQNSELKFVGIVKDISQRIEMESDLVKAKQDTVGSYRVNTELLSSSITHELKTSLNTIAGLANHLETDLSLSNTAKSKAKKIYQTGNHLLSLVNNLTNIVKLEAGQLQVKNEPLSLTGILDQAISYVNEDANEKQIQLTLNLGECQGEFVTADSVRLKQVLINILSNAIKFNRPGGEVVVCCGKSAGEKLEISIADIGLDISAEHQGDIVDPLNYMAAERSEVEGMGAELVTAESLIKLMHGEVTIASHEGKGSKFSVRLPIAIRKTDSNTDETTAAQNSNKGYVLVVEDNPTNRKLFKQQLEFLGYLVDVVDDGEQALKSLAANNYDLLLTDINMPIMNGYELAKIIRRGHSTIPLNLPIIAVTANSHKKESLKCQEAGINDYLPKPVYLAELDVKLLNWLKGDLQKGEINPASDAIAPSCQHFNPTMLHSTVGPDTGIHISLLRTFSASSSEILKDIMQAYNCEDTCEISALCHKLKSSSKAVGAVKMSQLCQALEMAAKDENWQEIHNRVACLTKEYEDLGIHIQRYINTHLTNDNLLSDLNFLIIDDDEFSITLMKNLIEQSDAKNILTATSGEAAVELMHNSADDIDIVFCDLNMPTMDGVEIIRHLSEQDFSGGIVLISGENERVLKSAENIAKARNLNLLGAIEKPLTDASLNEVITIYQSATSYNKIRRNADAVSIEKLKAAVSSKRIETYYQPKIEMKTGKLVGVEALARWQLRSKRHIPPNTFIPMAEDHQFINEITDIICQNAFSQMQKWLKSEEAFSISLNISVDSLVNLDLPEVIVNYANQYEVPVEKIVLEITESRLMQDITSAMDILTRMSLKGIKLSIDDFGTGYSSMEQLQRAPFSELKIDRSFVTNANDDKASRAILESSIDLGKKLDMIIVAEGIESQQDWDLLASLGVDHAQGFYISKPLPAAEFNNWLQYWRHKGIDLVKPF